MSKKQIVSMIIIVILAAASVSAEAKPSQPRHAVSAKPIKVLPAAHHRVRHRGNSYFYASGRFYRHSDRGYIAIAAPLGAVVPVLPRGYLSFGIGLNRYFYFGGTYYRTVDNGYEVVQRPEDAEALAAEGSDKLIVYPAAGQSDEVQNKDRYECHVWASGETQFDPTDSESDPILRADYRRALTACLEAKDYVVR